MRKFFIYSSLLFLSGCVTKQGFLNSLNSFVGKNAEYLVEQQGAPTQSFETKSGTLLYCYERSSIHKTDSYITNSGLITGGDLYTKSCSVCFILKRNIIQKYIFKGNNCYFGSEIGY